MRVEMSKRYNSNANVLPEEVPTWEAAGWAVVKQPVKAPKKDKEID